MKTSLLLILTSLLLSITTLTWAGCGFTGYGCGYRASCAHSISYLEGYSRCRGGNCDCADPGCSGTNSCLARGECCEAFGNIGAR